MATGLHLHKLDMDKQQMTNQIHNHCMLKMREREEMN